MAKRGKKNRPVVKLSWTHVRLLSLLLARYFYHALCLVRYLNPMVYMRLWRKQHLYVLDAEGSVQCSPSLWERFKAFFCSDAATRRRLLEWAQSHMAGLRISNLTTSWSDGIALCALMESLCPGACPRFDLLKAYNKVNNCRLGLKLANKHFSIPSTIITAEEMALSCAESEGKLRQFLSLIKWASMVQNHRHDNGTVSHGNQPSLRKGIFKSSRSNCSARGSGLVVGLVGRRCKFDVFAPPSEPPNLQIVIRGPQGEHCSETILHMFPKMRRMSVAHVSVERQATQLWKTGTTRVLGVGGRSVSALQRKVSSSTSTESVDDGKRLPFDFHCVGEGHFEMSYVPRSDGAHSIAIQWHGSHVKGSPFVALVAETIEKLNQEGRGKFRQKKVSFEGAHPAAPAAKESSGEREQSPTSIGDSSATPGGGGGGDGDVDGRQSMTGEKTRRDENGIRDIESQGDQDDMPCGVTAAVLNRTSKVQRSISRTGAATAKLAKQATVTRRRVLRRIITKGGQEIVIEEAPPTPRLSRECSSASDDCLGDLIDPIQVRKPRDNSLQVMTSYGASLKMIDSLNRARAPKKKIFERSGSIEQYIIELFDELITDAVLLVDDRQIINNIEGQTVLIKPHKRLASTKSAPVNIAKELTASLLLLPQEDTRFLCSPFTSAMEKSPMRFVRDTSLESLQSGHSSPVVDHKKLSLTRSLPPTRRASEASQNMKTSDSVEKRDSFRRNSRDRNETLHENQDEAGAEEEHQSSLLKAEDASEVKSINVTVRTQMRKNRRRTQNEKSGEKRKPKHGKKKRDLYIVMDNSEEDSVNDHAPVRKTNSDPPKRQQEKMMHDDPDVMGTMTVPSTPTFADPLVVVEASPSASGLSLEPDVASSHSGNSCVVVDPGNGGCPRMRDAETQQREMTYRLNSFLEDDCFDSNDDELNATRRHRPMLSGTMGHNRLRMSTSLPSLFRLWTAFEIDPDDEALTMEEMEALSMLAQKKGKRATLGTSDIKEALGEFHGFDDPDPERVFRDMKRQYSKIQEVSVDVDNRKLSPSAPGGSPLSDSLFVDIGSPPTPSPALSPLSSPLPSRLNSRRGSVVPSEALVRGKEGELESGSPTGGAATCEISSTASDHLVKEFDHSPREAYSYNSDMNKTAIATLSASDPTIKSPTGQHAPPIPASPPPAAPVVVNVPVGGVAKVDKWTQVCYDDIKAETDWSRPSTYVQPRRRILRSIAEDNPSSTESAPNASREEAKSDDADVFEPDTNAEGSTGENDNALHMTIPSLVVPVEITPPLVVLPDAGNRPGGAGSVGRDPTGSHLQPLRQSTVETVDSGIADDGSVSSFSRNHHSSPSSSAPLRVPTLVKPKVINGHRMVTRNRYRGKITLDPKLISSSPNSPVIASVDDKSKLSTGDHLRRKAKAVIQALRYSRSNSGGRHTTYRPNSRDESVTDYDNRVLRKRGASQKVTCGKRRVRFSRRVMMYRRSSSRNSSKHSNEERNELNVREQVIPEAILDSTVGAVTGAIGQIEIQVNSRIHNLNPGAVADLDVMPIFPCPAHDQVSGVTNGEEAATLPWRLSPSGEEEAQADQRQEGEQGDSTDTFDGFGVSASTRRDLLDEIDAFSRISSEAPAGTTARLRQRKRGGSAPDALRHLRLSNSSDFASFDAAYGIYKPSTSDWKSCSEAAAISTELYHSDCSNKPAVLATVGLPADKALDRVAEYLEATYGEKTAASQTGETFGDLRAPTKAYLNQYSYTGTSIDLDSVFTSIDIGEAIPVTTIAEEQPVQDLDLDSLPYFEDDSQDKEVAEVPDPFRCRAFGVGLSYGTVGAKNFFEVSARTAGNGNLCVNIIGPRPRTVTETSVIFTGDDLYEITYEVTQPGTYIINVKWSDYHIPNSPFISRVSFGDADDR